MNTNMSISSAATTIMPAEERERDRLMQIAKAFADQNLMRKGLELLKSNVGRQQGKRLSDGVLLNAKSNPPENQDRGGAS